MPDVASANFVRAVGQLVLTRHLQGLHTVVLTTNYDDLLEKALLTDTALATMRRSAGITEVESRRAIAPPENSPDTLPIYHIHGFIPKDESLQPEDPAIVLSSRDYGTDWSDHWSSDLLKPHWDDQWLFVGSSFADPHLTYFAAQRQLHDKDGSDRPAPPAAAPIAIFCLQARDWKTVDPRLRPFLIRAETSRLRELGATALPTDYFFQDAQFLREVCLAIRKGTGKRLRYTNRLKKWRDKLIETRLFADDPQAVRLYLETVSHYLLEIRTDVEALAPRGGQERFKCELWCRDIDGYSLFQVGSSEVLAYDLARGRRFALTDAAAASATFTEGSPECLAVPQLHEHGRWKSFFGAPIIIGAGPWFDLPVGALVIASTAPLKKPTSTLIASESAVRKQLESWLRPLKRALDPHAEFSVPATRTIVDMQGDLDKTVSERKQHGKTRK